MVRAWFDRARPVTSIVAALLLMFISLGVSGTAFAKSGNGNGHTAASSHSTHKSSKATTTKKSTKTKSSKSTTRSSKSTTTRSSKSTSTKSTGSSRAGTHSTAGTSGTSGDATKPQPISNADSNTGGANGQCTSGPYCSTRDGSASLNGNGGGKSTGKPCAGCVGKADNKNPKGQMPGPQDKNNGYECDGNNGIAKGNPAHTACAPTAGTPPGDCVPPTGQTTCETPCVKGSVECPKPPCVTGSTECPNPVCVTGAANCPNPVCVTGAANCPSPPKGVELNRPPAVLGVQAMVGMQQPAAVSPANAAAAQPSQGALPNTGASDLTGLLAATGFGLLIVGGAVLAMRRRGSIG